ncbi:MAG: hypothetical protein ACRDLA_19735 [Thermoleophilaceae bacterium]
MAVPIAVWGIGWWDVAASLVAFPLIAAASHALVVGLYERYAPRQLERPHLICSGPTCAVICLVVGAAALLTILTPIDEVAIWVFFGASMLVAAVRGYGGCEVLAFPNAITGRRDQIGCMLYGPIDALEARRGTARASTGRPT